MQIQGKATKKGKVYKEYIYNGFSKVFWDDKSNSEIPYINLVERSASYEFEVYSWEELDSVISARSTAKIKLGCDILVEGIIDTEFTGTLNGNGYSFVFTDYARRTNFNFKDADSMLEDSFTSSKLHNFVKGDKNYIGIFSIATKTSARTGANYSATFNNINVIVDKALTTSGLIRNTQNNYVSLLVAYAKNTTLTNCQVVATSNGRVKVTDDNISTIITYGTIVGYADNTKINNGGNN